MSSPTVTALDFLLVTFGVAPLKYFIWLWYERRKNKRKKQIEECISTPPADNEKSA